MQLKFTSLNSGSNGNCYYVGNDDEAVLIDAGISCRETEKRMARLGLSMKLVKAIFISHEHSDHIRGVPVLASKYNLPVYVSHKTLQHCPFKLNRQQVRYLQAQEDVLIGALCIRPFPKLHDASEPHSFVVSCAGKNVGVFTDIGKPCIHLTYHFKTCHAAFLESNYDEELLDKGRYPIYLKNRIRGGQGHLSNKEALLFFKEHKPHYMQHLVLAHLSKENNCPNLVHQLFTKEANGTQVTVASRYEETALFSIHCDEEEELRAQKNAGTEAPFQLSLF